MTLSIHSERTNLFDDLFHNYHQPSFSIRTFDGWTWRSSKTDPPACVIALKTPRALRALLQEPSELTLGEAFIDGNIDIKGDIFSVFPIAEYILGLPADLQSRAIRGLSRFFGGIAQYCRLGPRHSQARDRASIAHHYDQPAEFYRPWLGKTLVYSCAYFRNPNEDLDRAQENKLELICRKLRLEETDRLLDIGCGWGSLVLHAAQQYGVEARGITLSRAQAAVATQRIQEAKLDSRCAIEFLDYRNAAKLPGPFDKISSVGMFEHVGLSKLNQYFSVAFEMLKPGGLFLNHGIGRAAWSAPRKESFIDKHVFPDGQLVTIGQAVRLAEATGFEVRDVENLREHYERTLRFWVEALEENSRILLKTVSERTYRIWLLYMAGSSAAFRRGDIAIYQMLLRRPRQDQHRAPATREDWYRSWPPAVESAPVPAERRLG